MNSDSQRISNFLFNAYGNLTTSTGVHWLSFVLGDGAALAEGLVAFVECVR